MRKLVFATHNHNKMKEIQSLMPDDIQLLSLDDIDCFEDIEETESTIEGNAILKAKYIKKKYGYDVFADDTGLEVKVLAGQPGVYSARYAGNHKSDANNMRLLLQNMEGKTDREAQFKTVIALCLGDDTHVFEGIVKGTITNAPIGTNGFGYDPVFQPIGFSETFAQLPLTTKNEIGHRGKAFKELLDFLRKI
ncbi:non-canonical purine NTP pyrophosphatase [Capnocytophaga stomatis]|uniref:dITP/XTP pyrophosphatase n=1 Tax=Capnocytophaga stomatis TaxID=1848904 RepID=A0A250FZI9_9FLAO|nr:non-canonical purine NTP diphosphatase [Capnocytophaga stomatis]ATA90411.1 non-canonical purine NTP pyrophosphatase [Capnocytophaga stomatis]GIJ97140.1 non-canonical purine NTP pyrophosphatase [Capnocytophaga stomatis]GIM49524.1 non-canonical purine NTP pyrophosphatase [Capnocytophaga stomatis]